MIRAVRRMALWPNAGVPKGLLSGGASFPLALLTIFLLSAPPVGAQEEGDSEADLAEENKEEDESPGWRDRWNLGAELSFTGQSGNSDLRVFSGGFTARHLDRDRYRLDLSLESRYGRSGEDVVATRHEGSLAFDLRPQHAFTPSLFTTAQRDPIRRLDLRLSSGAGVKYTLERPRRTPETSLTLSLLHDFERVPGAQEVEPALARHRARWRLEARGGQRLHDTMTLEHRSSFQPVWDDPGDYLFRATTATRANITERLALSISYRFNRNARPPEDVAPDDHTLQTGIAIDL